jgi:hypothetical protein
VRALFSLPLSTNYNYRAVYPGVMPSARVFNLAVAPTLKNHSRLAFRKRMDAFGLRYNDTGMSVGLRVSHSRNGSNLGINLFAQQTQDNAALGERTATDEELFHYWRLELLSERHWSKAREYTLDAVYDRMSRGVGVWPEHGKWTLLNTSSVLERVDGL